MFIELPPKIHSPLLLYTPRLFILQYLPHTTTIFYTTRIRATRVAAVPSQLAYFPIYALVSHLGISHCIFTLF